MKPNDKTLVWDLPLRVFHWLLALSFAGAYVTAESERWMLVHITLGYTMAGLVAFRLLWGLVGTRTARFASFVRGPRAALAYLLSLRQRQPQHHLGHNPAGGLAIVAMLTLTVVVAASGWLAQDLRLGALEELHESAAEFMLLLVAVHVAAVAISSWLHRENLVRAMVSGYKRGASPEGIAHKRQAMAVLVLAGVLSFWGWQWSHAPALTEQAATAVGKRHAGVQHDDD